MTEADLNELLAKAARVAERAAIETAEFRQTLPGLLVERKEWERDHRTLARVVLVSMALSLMAVLLGAGALIVAVKDLRIVQSATNAPARQAATNATDVAICRLVNDNRHIHGEPLVDPCPPTTKPPLTVP